MAAQVVRRLERRATSVYRTFVWSIVAVVSNMLG